jgi:predicted glycosyltransferase
MRILCYAQHLSGVGHFVRMTALACELAQAHEVHLVDGGRPVPRRSGALGPRLVVLPRLLRKDGALVTLDGEPLRLVQEARRRHLTETIAAAPPDVMMIEHYPWSKWELEEEILAAIQAARNARADVRVVCSLRDVAPQTRQESVSAPAYERRVLERLAAYFDAVLIHSDPRFSRLIEHFPAAGRLPVPSAYTGFVCRVGERAAVEHGPGGTLAAPSYAVLSAGGSADALPFFLNAMEAFRRLAARGELGSLRLLVFAGLAMGPPALETLRAAAREAAVSVVPFSPDFPAWLRRSALSISQAGYNTCADVLATRVPAVLVANPRMSDQPFRAERMRANGLATVATGDPPPIASLETAILSALRGPRPCHDLAVCGAGETRALLERLHGTGTLGGHRPAA